MGKCGAVEKLKFCGSIGSPRTGKSNNIKARTVHPELVEGLRRTFSTAPVSLEFRDRDSRGFVPLKKDAKEGGAVAGRTRKNIEKHSGKKVISSGNFKGLAGTGKKGMTGS